MTDIKVITISPQSIKVVNVGSQGPQGAGIATGGLSGQYLKKTSNDDFDTEWGTLSGGGDLLSTNNLSDVSNVATARTNLGLSIGSDVQAYSLTLSNTTASFTTAQETKLSGIEANATSDQTDSEIKTAYENNSDTNAFTDLLLSKLNGIASGAEVNQNTFSTISVSGQNDVVADGKTDTLNLVAGGNITITTDASTDTLTISSSGGGGGGAGDAWSDVVDSDIIPDADGIRDLGSTGTRFAEIYTDTIDVTNNITVGGTVDGRSIASDGAKLDTIETNATGDQAGSEIKTLYEGEADTNAFTDSLLSKLNGIETSATADQTDSEIKTAYENNTDTNAFTDAEKTKLSTVESNATSPDDTAFASSWDGITSDAPTKNAVYDALSEKSITFGFLSSAEDETAKIKMPYDGTINSLDDLYLASGSIDVEVRISSTVNGSGTVVTSLTSLTATTTPTDTTATANNTFSSGDYIFIIFSSDSSSDALSGTLNITRTG